MVAQIRSFTAGIDSLVIDNEHEMDNLNFHLGVLLKGKLTVAVKAKESMTCSVFGPLSMKSSLLSNFQATCKTEELKNRNEVFILQHLNSNYVRG